MDDSPGVCVTMVKNKATEKVMFVLANKEFVDLLISFLTIPLGTLSKLVGDRPIGSLKNIYECVKGLEPDSFWKGNTAKELFLSPLNSSERHLTVNITEPTEYFACVAEKCPYHSVTRSKAVTKCDCGSLLEYPGVHLTGMGFIADAVAIYIIADDLVIRPFNLENTGLSLRLNLGIADDVCIDVTEEVVMKLTKTEVLELVNLSIFSDTPLSDFLFKRDVAGRPQASGLLSCFNVDQCNVVGEDNNINLGIRLVIHKPTNSLAFAYVDNDFLDVILSFLSFPLGSVVTKFGRNTFLAIDNLHASISKLNDNKLNHVLRPLVPREFAGKTNILPVEHQRTNLFFYGRRSIYRNNFEDGKYILLEDVSDDFHHDFQEVSLITQSAGEPGKGFLKAPSTYIISTDLLFKHLSPLDLVDLPEYYEVDANDLVEHDVFLGIKEASLTSSTPLDDALKHLFPGFNGGGECHQSLNQLVDRSVEDVDGIVKDVEDDSEWDNDSRL
ncbi:hypothetical protein OROGR_027257 [Orobanche gracilis]